MRALFLDFDGPLHPTDAVLGLTPGIDNLRESIPRRNLFRWLGHLSELLEGHEDVGLVVHSNWRKFADNSELREALGPLGHMYVGITPVDLPRAAGIQAIVERFEITEYLAIDDAPDEFPDNFPHLCLVSPITGLSDDAARAALSQWLASTHPNNHPASAAPAQMR